MPGYGDDRGHYYARQVFDSISSITRTAHQAIAERALLRSKFSPPKEVARGVDHRLRASADRRVTNPAFQYLSVGTENNNVRSAHGG